MRYYPPRNSTLVTQCEQCRLCLVKDMKTLCMSVNYAAGMSAEPPQCVEQLMVRLAWLCVSSGCLVGAEGALLVSVPKADWPSCCLLGLWWAAESLRRNHWGFQAACLQRSSIFVPPTFFIYFPCVHCTLWGNTHIHARMIPPFDWLFVDMTRFPKKMLYAINPCGLQAMFL